MGKSPPSKTVPSGQSHTRFSQHSFLHSSRVAVALAPMIEAECGLLLVPVVVRVINSNAVLSRGLIHFFMLV